jgi:hypothetical protein
MSRQGRAAPAEKATRYSTFNTLFENEVAQRSAVNCSRFSVCTSSAWLFDISLL